MHISISIFDNNQTTNIQNNKDLAVVNGLQSVEHVGGSLTIQVQFSTIVSLQI